MVCFDEHYVKFDTLVADPATGDSLKRFIVFHEEGKEIARFVLPNNGSLTRWEIQAAAKDAIKLARRRRRQPARLQLVA
jgi:hypothetical protein